MEERIKELEKRVAELEVRVQGQPNINYIKINKSDIKAKVIEVINVTTNKGDGTLDNPVRIVNQYWSLTGELLAEDDFIE